VTRTPAREAGGVRVCANCRGSLAGRRSDARCCGAACRAEAWRAARRAEESERLRAAQDGDKPAEWFWSSRPAQPVRGVPSRTGEQLALDLDAASGQTKRASTPSEEIS
jgi:hypothetical protein